jgi:hypothetical protein
MTIRSPNVVHSFCDLKPITVIDTFLFLEAERIKHLPQRVDSGWEKLAMIDFSLQVQ